MAAKSKAHRTRLLVAIAVIAVAVAAVLLYAHYAISSIVSTANYTPATPLVPGISASIASQELLYGSNGNVSPYFLIAYNAVNTSQISVEASVYKSRIPQDIYLLDTNNECFNCGSSSAIDAALTSDLVGYGVVGSANDIKYVGVAGIGAVPSNSVLIVLTGLMPSAFFAAQGPSNTPVITSLLNRGVSIIYAGQDFSHMLLPGSIVVPTNLTNLGFLATTSPVSNSTPGYYFNRSTFSLANGNTYGSLSYENVYNGSLIAFPNTPNSWPSASAAGHDVALAIQQLFWAGRYSQGATSATYSSGAGTGYIGIALSSSALSPGFLAQINNGSARISLKAVSPSQSSTNTTYSYIYFTPRFSLNGSIMMPSQITPGTTVPVTMTVYTRSSHPISIQPHITLYALNMTPVGSIPLPFTNATGNFTFIKYIDFGLGPGTYIASLQSFTNVHYAAAMFNVSQVQLSLSSSNFAKGAFVFSLSSGGQPLSGINYTISVNGAYPSHGTVSNGTIAYTLPAGTPAQQGHVDFDIAMLGQTFHYGTYNTPTTITINKQYIELGIVGIVAILMVVLVRAPSRDEFYIDVPSLPEQEKTQIELKPKDMLAVFDKLNMSYHWRYMPLSLPELRVAITGNIRYNNMPVSLTYANIESLLNSLAVNGFVVQADGLYAPKEWLQLSKHDIEYLATFKKLRLFLVTHAYVFTELDTSGTADIVATLRGQRKYLIIYSKTSKFSDIPIFADAKTYLVFLNAYKLDEFKEKLYQATGTEAEMLRSYLSAGMVRLVDADNPANILG